MKPHSPDPERIRLVLTFALAGGALMMIAVGVYLLTTETQQLSGIVLVVLGVVEAGLAMFVPRLLAKRVAESRRQQP